MIYSTKFVQRKSYNSQCLIVTIAYIIYTYLITTRLAANSFPPQIRQQHTCSRCRLFNVIILLASPTLHLQTNEKHDSVVKMALHYMNKYIDRPTLQYLDYTYIQLYLHIRLSIPNPHCKHTTSLLHKIYNHKQCNYTHTQPPTLDWIIMYNVVLLNITHCL